MIQFNEYFEEENKNQEGVGNQKEEVSNMMSQQKAMMSKSMSGIPKFK